VSTLLASHSHFYFGECFSTQTTSASMAECCPAGSWAAPAPCDMRLPPKVNPGPGGAHQPCMAIFWLTVDADGGINFEFQNLDEASVPAAIVTRYKPEFVHWCWGSKFPSAESNFSRRY